MKDLFNKVSEKVSESKDNMLDSFEGFSLNKLSEKLGNMSDSAKEKSVAFMNDLLTLPPIIEEIGFCTTAITVTVGLPPDVTFHFSKIKDISAEERERIMAAHKDKAMLNPIVKTLFVADGYQQKLKLGNFRLTNIDVCVGLTGGVTFQLAPKTEGE